MRPRALTFFLFVLLALLPVFSVWAKIPDDPEVKQWAYEDTKIYDAWNYFTGSKRVIVAIIDNGFDTFHPDLYDNVWRNEDEISNNGIDDDNNGYIDDVWGWNFIDNNNKPRPEVEKMSELEKTDGIFSHATLVAGLIGAVGDNNLGMAGVNWRVKLMNLKVINVSGEGDFQFLYGAIRYAVDNGADVINISLVGTDTPETHKQVKEAIKYAYEKGVAVFAAAGNNMESLADYSHYPICADADEKEQWIFGVSAITESHHLAIFSNTGGGCVDITAPGVDVTSTVRFSPTNGLTKMVSGGWRGTSFATPLVSGVAALLKGINPEWRAKEIYQALAATTHHTPGQDEVVYAKLFGAGLLQTDKAVEYALQRIVRDENLLVFNKNTGKGIIKNLRTGEETAVQTSALRDIESLSVYKNNGKTRFVAIKKEENKNIANFYDSLWGFQKSELVDTAISSSSTGNSLISDIDGDGEDELVKTNETYVEIYNSSGSLQRKFLAFDVKSDIGLDFLLLDYDGDGRKDIVVFAPNSGQPIRIWNYKIKKIFEWQPGVAFGAEAKILSY